jgi:hypothetical protein
MPCRVLSDELSLQVPTAFRHLVERLQVSGSGYRHIRPLERGVPSRNRSRSTTEVLCTERSEMGESEAERLNSPGFQSIPADGE